MNYDTFITELADESVNREYSTASELVSEVVTVVRLYQGVIENERAEIEQERQVMLPETEVMIWMVVAIVIHDVLEELAERTEFSYDELAAEVPDQYVHSSISNR